MTVSRHFTTIAFPAVGTGDHGFPFEIAAKIACKTVNQFLLDDDNRAQIQLVVFCVLDTAMEVYEGTMRL